ncbi:hypothetical protein IEQ34_005742 [Dendrobium chrysotoxum]|uniref:Myb/SANT-like domain-containing protein n=1 Tax=Dendrobium chrysotoxum TaxID=161865 RepID=A0AAV7HC19_DENCH|nr:hypothetical protein IEQ34_005742 [Dendrobium chrysotoxum]
MPTPRAMVSKELTNAPFVSVLHTRSSRSQRLLSQLLSRLSAASYTKPVPPPFTPPDSVFRTTPRERRRMNSSQTEMNGTSKPKRKNFLWSLKPEWITGLLQIMIEYVNANMQSSQGFKGSVYQGAAQKMKEKFGIEVTSEQCKNQIRHQRSVWIHIQELKRKSGVSWDETKKMIVMGQEEYASHIQAFPKDAAYLNIAIANYVELEIVCGLGHATGEWAKSENSQTPLGTQEIDVGDDEPSQFTDVGADGSMTNEWFDMQVMEDSSEKTKKSLPSSATGGGIKRKSKTSTIDQDICECICLMADSVTEVANAIKNSITSPKQIRNMYTELMFELTNIPGFSEEEVDTIYDNLSKNPTLIPSFLSKPTDSKARWMRKELGK